MRATPAFGSDPVRVRGYTTGTGQRVYRVFVPVELPDGGSESWEEACQRLGIPFSCDVRWSQISYQADRQQQVRGVPAYGMLGRSFVERLLAAWPGPPTTLTWFAFWAGYAESVDEAADRQDQQFLPASQKDFLHNGEFSLHRKPADFLLRLSSEANHHFPSAVWTEDHSTIFAGPLYADSFFLTCTQEIYRAMTDAGVEL